jgi:hypothetical protein
MPILNRRKRRIGSIQSTFSGLWTAAEAYAARKSIHTARMNAV